MPVTVLIVEKITDAERIAIAEVFGKRVIEAALQNAEALKLLREAQDRRTNWTPPTRDEIRREEELTMLERDMQQKSTGRLGSAT